MKEKSNFVFFGSAEFSVLVLEELKKLSLTPSLIITSPDKPKGRKLLLTPNIVKTWAIENNIEVATPEKLSDPALSSKLSALKSDFFLVVAYGKILKKEIFDMPKYKTLNIHPSLLPRYRGASPMISQILEDEKEIGTTIMVIDEGMDTGSILAQKKINISNWPLNISEMESVMAQESASLLSEILPKYLEGSIEPKPQDGEKATECKKIKKEDGILDLNLDPYKNLLKIKAFSRWPRSYFILDGKRVIVTEAELEDSKLKIKKVIPEGKSEMSYEDFLRGQRY